MRVNTSQRRTEPQYSGLVVVGRQRGDVVTATGSVLRSVIERHPFPANLLGTDRRQASHIGR